MSLLEQDITRKEQVDKNVTELDIGKSKKYKLKAIWDSIVYIEELEAWQLLGLYYLVVWKGYLKVKNTWKPSLAVQHLKKLICSFYKKYLEKPTVTFLLINSAPPMIRSIVKLMVKAITK